MATTTEAVAVAAEDFNKAGDTTRDEDITEVVMAMEAVATMAVVGITPTNTTTNTNNNNILNKKDSLVLLMKGRLRNTITTTVSRLAVAGVTTAEMIAVGTIILLPIIIGATAGD